MAYATSKPIFPDWASGLLPPDVDGSPLSAEELATAISKTYKPAEDEVSLAAITNSYSRQRVMLSWINYMMVLQYLASLCPTAVASGQESRYRQLANTWSMRLAEEAGSSGGVHQARKVCNKCGRETIHASERNLTCKTCRSRKRKAAEKEASTAIR